MLKSFLNYLTYERKYSRHTVAAYETDLNQLINFQQEQGQEVTLEELVYGDLRAWIISLMNEGLKEKSINRKLASVNAFYRFLQRKEFRSDNPADKLKSLKTPKILPQFVKKGEVQKLLTAASEVEIPIRDRVILELLYGTGMRSAELVGLQWSSVDFRKRQLKVLGKRNKERFIPLPERLIHLLKEWKAYSTSLVSEFVICTDSGEQAYPMLIYRTVKQYLSLNTSVQKQSPHVLRHTYATHLLDNGADLNAIKELLGHASLASTQVYTHNSIDRLRQVFDKAHPRS